MDAPHPPTTRLICPLTATDVPAMRAAMLRAAQLGADAIECRLDYLATPPTRRELRQLFADAPAPTIATCRPTRQGGRFTGDEGDRLAILRQAADCGATWIDLERDVHPAAAAAAGIPPERTILSHHDFAAVPADLDALAAELAATPAAVSKVAFAAPAGPEDAFRALDVLRSAAKPTLALAMGEAGVLSRILAGKFGAFGTFAALAAGAGSAPGQPTIEELLGLYRFREVSAATAVYGVIGCPVGHSMSPAIHNAAFAAAGIDAVYVPLLVQPGHDNFRRFLDAIRQRPWLDWGGLSVTIPHKENALAYVRPDHCDELARTIGAVNTISFRPGGELRGDNTDYAGAIDALCAGMGIARTALAGRNVAVVGAGGAARALVAALVHYGAAVTVYNRTVARAEALAEELACHAAGLEALPAMDAEIVINCTSLGMHPLVEGCPMEAIPPGVKVVFDTIYNPADTLLLRRARQAGCTCVTGLEMFVNQAVAQFEIWTGRPAPRQVMRQVVENRLKGSANP